jgi:hypothetical protein
MLQEPSRSSGKADLRGLGRPNGCADRPSEGRHVFEVLQGRVRNSYQPGWLSEHTLGKLARFYAC